LGFSHALVDALGNPVNFFFLTGGEAHDLVGADHLLPSMQADTLIADKAFDADERVIAPLAAAGKIAVIPPKANRRLPRDYDRHKFASIPTRLRDRLELGNPVYFEHFEWLADRCKRPVPWRHRFLRRCSRAPGFRSYRGNA
jgi:transposase